jgi:hypothetical protein
MRPAEPKARGRFCLWASILFRFLVGQASACLGLNVFWVEVKGRQAEACPTGENDEHNGAREN